MPKITKKLLSDYFNLFVTDEPLIIAANEDKVKDKAWIRAETPDNQLLKRIAKSCHSYGFSEYGEQIDQVLEAGKEIAKRHPSKRPSTDEARKFGGVKRSRGE